MDEVIGGNLYVTGDELTIADLSLLASFTVFTITGFDLTDFNNVKNWFERLQNELPYYEEINGDVHAVKDFALKIREKFATKYD